MPAPISFGDSKRATFPPAFCLHRHPNWLTFLLARDCISGEEQLPSLLLELVAAAAAIAPEAHGALLTNGRDIISAADYPLVSLRNNDQGTVKVKLTVDPTGLVSACAVTASSGHPELDEQTCALFRARATFRPATDSNGKAITSYYTQTVNWQLAGAAESAVPRTAWMTRTTIGYDANGAVASCTIDFDGMGSGSAECPKAAGAIPIVSSAKPVRHEISEVRFYPGAPASAPSAPVPDGSTLSARQVSEVTISPDGQVISCTATTFSGPAEAPPDHCLTLNDLRFKDGPAENGPTIGTLVHSGYVRSSGSD